MIFLAIFSFIIFSILVIKYMFNNDIAIEVKQTKTNKTNYK